VDTSHYGTQSQQDQLKSLIDKFDTDQELVTIQTYKIKNQYAQDIADVLSGIVTGQTGSDNSNPFLPGGNPFNAFQRQFQGNQQGGGTRSNRSSSSSGRASTSSLQGGTTSSRSAQARSQQNSPGGGNIRPIFMGNNQGGRQPQPGAEGAAGLGGEDVFIMADSANNQVIVKAPKGQQEEFAHLIAKLDQRRPQVQIEVQIVSVTATDDFRLAVETQGIIGQFAFNTNFGLGSLTGGTPTAPTGGFTSRKNVATDLPGITAAFIKSTQVPIIVTALKNNFDSRILSNPQVTVDDNVEATIESTDQQPTSSTSQTNSSTISNFGGYEEAGTVVTVLPSISEGGYMRLNYDIELSNFVGSGAAGFPPPKQVRHVTSESVTIPGDTTIIVGGIKVDTKTSNISKIPILGDIPLLGFLFRDTNKSNSSTRLYIFITPRILRDPNFRDQLLLTEGPLRDAGLLGDIPPMEPVMMELAGRSGSRVSSAAHTPAVSEPPAAPPAAPPSTPSQPDHDLTRPPPPAPGGQPSTEGF
jgi:type II secretory pathway component GspD/PulD (secretin)